MNNNEEKIPPFVQDYLDKMHYEGYGDFVKLSRDYFQEREDYPGKYATQSAYLHNYNLTVGGNKILNYEDGLKDIDNKYRKQAYQTAKQHGYTGPDPNQPSDKEFTKQGEKFQSMIDNAQERQQLQQRRQAEQKPEDDNGHEKKNINSLKEQQSYQQSQPKVEFNGVQPSGTDEERAAFLKQIKQIREQQTQRQQNQQPEI